ncbi:MAG TPA: bifunctional DNA-formamidopyrimidine glycosylase/DNA-(apurinic or apyrimidinic site) lyase [Verrucomicrobiae bacterium]|nr:bifunctional DNA-formamidopyrimidine glycosylase/DNA-(apurinic or apyrimidinic site) lyase [Verrucomicrobiae bacterium]
MPELPEVEVLARHLAPLLKGRTIHAVSVNRSRVLAPTSEPEFISTLAGTNIKELVRRGKYLLFTLQKANGSAPFILLGHLGMTGRMFVSPKSAPLPKHAAVVLDLGAENFIFQDTRYFGRLTLDASAIAKLGPEPLGPKFTVNYFADALKRSTQSIKVKLLDQMLVAGIGNIYASEALFRAGISPRIPARKLTPAQVKTLHGAIRQVLTRAIRLGGSIPLDFSGEEPENDGLFYYGSAGNQRRKFEERFWVYDRADKPCLECGRTLRRIVQGARSTFYCPGCQPS